MPIHIKYEHTAELTYDFAKHYWKSKRLLKIILGATIGILLIQFINILTQDPADMSKVWSVLLPVAMILVIWFWLIPASLKKQALQGAQSKQGTERELIFSEEEIIIKTAHSESSFDYEGLLHHSSSALCHFLFIATNQALIVPKAALSADDEHALMDLLEQKKVPFLP